MELEINTIYIKMVRGLDLRDSVFFRYLGDNAEFGDQWEHLIQDCYTGSKYTCVIAYFTLQKFIKAPKIIQRFFNDA